MRVLLLDTLPVWGGGERWALDTARLLAARGHPATLVARDGGPLARRAAERGIALRALRPGWASSLRAPGELARALSEAPPDVLLALTGRDLRLALRLRRALARRGARPGVVLRRGLDRPVRDHPWHRRAWRETDAVIANSEATRGTILASLPWLEPARVRVIPNVLDAEAFRRFRPRDVRAEHRLAPGAIVAAIVGRCVPQKGHEVLLRAMARLERDAAGPRLHLLVVGDGPSRPRLERLAASLGIAERVRFTGEVEEVQPFLLASDMAVVASHFEGFGYAAAEALLLGRPVVAAAASSLTEIVEAGRTGLFFPPGDDAALAVCLERLAGDPLLRRELGEAAARQAARRFGAEAPMAALESLLKGVVPTPSGG